MEEPLLRTLLSHSLVTLLMVLKLALMIFGAASNTA